MTYKLINTMIKHYEPTISAAEIHGLATGMLTVDSQTESISWINEVFLDEVDLVEQEKSILMALFDQTRELLNGDEFTFDLLLPDQEYSLPSRVEGIINWCQGFLYGLGSASSASDWPGESSEILKDIVEITKMEATNDNEEEEHALMEIHEYLRAAVLLLRDALKDRGNDKVIH